MKPRLLFAVPLAALALIGALVLLIQPAGAIGTAPMVRTENVQNVLMATQTITATPVPAALVSAPVRVDGYTSADIFVTSAFSGAGDVTIAVQFAADDSNYADAYYEYLEVTGDSGDTDTLIRRQYITLYLDDDGTDYVSLPVRGQNMRLEFETTGLTGTENVAPTVRVVLKN